MPPHAPRDAWTPESRIVGALDVPVDLPLATVGTRGLAAAIDALVIFLLDAFLIAALLLAVGALQEAGRLALVALVLGLFAIHYGYFALLEALLDGQTLGKRTLGIRVVEIDGTRLGLLGALIRNLVRFIDFLPAGYGVGVAAILVTERCQRLGDLAAGTLVVREEAGDAARASLAPLEGLEVGEIKLLEEYLAVRHGLVPERREAVAQAIVAWLERRHPELASRLPQSASAADALEHLLVAAPPAGPATD